MYADLDEQLQLTHQQVEHRLQMGDRMSVAREVDQSAHFRRSDDAAAAADELRSKGYPVELRRRWLRVEMEATHHSSVELVTAEASTREVFGVVIEHNGEYEGWGALVET